MDRLNLDVSRRLILYLLGDSVMPCRYSLPGETKGMSNGAKTAICLLVLIASILVAIATVFYNKPIAEVITKHHNKKAGLYRASFELDPPRIKILSDWSHKDSYAFRYIQVDEGTAVQTLNGSIAFLLPESKQSTEPEPITPPEE